MLLADPTSSASTSTSASQYWLVKLFHEQEPAQAVLVVAIVGALGLLLGHVKVRGIGLGIAGVLFVGLAAGHVLGKLSITLDAQVMHFAREFGLILFVYTIGVQVGPGFVASLRRHGLPLNLMAAAIVLLGVIVTLLLHYVGGIDTAAVVGLFSGATTNTPSLAAAQQALKDAPGVSDEILKIPGMSYAIAYPFGIVGIILTMLIVRGVFRISTTAEAEALAKLNADDDQARGKMQTVNLEVRNANLDGLRLAQIPTLGKTNVVISRVMHSDGGSSGSSGSGKAVVASADTVIRTGDVLYAVGPARELDSLRLVVGAVATVDLKALPGTITTRRVIVTNKVALGKTIDELNLRDRFGVNVTRVNRAEIDMPPRGLELQFGDNLVVVGEPEAVKLAAAELGDSVQRLNRPQIIPVFIGIALGVLLGSWPVSLPGMPAPVKLGLAGGPLIVAILLSRLGHVGPLVWYLPISANTVLREIGIVLFLSCVGILSGGRFVETVLHGPGLYWMACGALITIVPLLLVAFAGRLIWNLNYLSLCGMLAGSMTDPPALAFATSITGSEAPSVSYATVYPLVMLLRVLAAQVMVLTMAR
jgi:putative transport protein